MWNPSLTLCSRAFGTVGLAAVLVSACGSNFTSDDGDATAGNAGMTENAGSTASGGATGRAGASGAGGTANGGKGGASGGGGATSGSGGATSGGATSSGGTSGSTGSAGAGGSAVDLDDLGQPCVDGDCPAGLTPVHYCGIAGCEISSFCSCEIPCTDDPDACPEGTSCASISDGPGDVCVPS